MIKTLDTFSQDFLSYAISQGAHVLSIRYQPSSKFLCYTIDDSNGEASKALEEWISDRVWVNAKGYASAMRYVIRITSEFRKKNANRTTAATEGEFKNDHARTATR